jgi:hypothetical protein
LIGRRMTYAAQYRHGTPTDTEILMLWRGGKDTHDIAKQLWVPEYYVANRLPRILERVRQNQEWNYDNIVCG